MNYRSTYRTPIKQQPRGHGLLIVILFLIFLLLVAGYSYYALCRPLPLLQPTTRSLNLRAATGTSQLTWPATGQSAVAVENSPVLETHGAQTPVAIASVAKVITALVVLQQKPLMPGQAGPTITLTDADAALYNSYVAQLGSVVPVSVGEQITERQMLEALMLPSANNIADSMAIWAFGSLDAYRTHASQYVLKLGLHDTHIGSDASGFSPNTTSTARDLVLLGKQAMDNPVLRQIVGESSSTNVPLTDSVTNVNSLLGTNNIVGIKTGNTDQAGGVYLSASTTTLGAQSLTVITALVGAPSLFEALHDSLPLITSAQANFVSAKLLAAHAVVGEYQLPWGSVLPATITNALVSPAWRGSTVTAHVDLQPISATAKAGQIVGSANSSRTNFSQAGTTNVVLQKAPTAPTTWWRLLHPLSR